MTHEFHHPTKVAIVGIGNVGASLAYALTLNGLAKELVLIDHSRAKAEGEAMDLNHTVPLTQPAKIWAGDYADCAGAAVTVITAGSAQKPGETRLDLAERNADIFREIVPQIVKYNPYGLIVVASNPVDVLSYVAWKISGLPSARVIGSGTLLDTARFRYLLSQRFDVDARSVHAYIIGEHGDSEVPVWSLANIGGMRLPTFCAANGLSCDQDQFDEIFKQTKNAAYEIIQRKGATYYAIGAGLMRILEAIIRDQGTVLSVSTLITDYYCINDVYLSLPSVIDAEGTVRSLRLDLDGKEMDGLCHSAEILKNTIKKIGF